LYYELAANAAKVTVKVLDDSGAVVRQINTGGQKSGTQSTIWDGKNGLGQRLPPGVYNFEVSAVDGAGNAIPVTQQIRGMVTGISFEGPEPIFEIGQLKIPSSSITAIR
jgi:flagellar basal-body rod modification protein FlgD